MGLTCQCPAAEYLTTIPNVVCGESFGQIQKVVFQRLYQANGTPNAFVGSGTPLAPSIGHKASWTSLLNASNSTKVVVSPYLEAPTSEPGAARTFGGGNDTLGGVERILGAEPTAFSGVFRRVPQDVIKIMKELMCEADAGNLGVYLINENGQIEGLKDPTTPTTVHPIPIRALFISDKGHGGLEAPDLNNISWQFMPNYSDNLEIFDTDDDFNPLTDLVPTV